MEKLQHGWWNTHGLPQVQLSQGRANLLSTGKVVRVLSKCEPFIRQFWFWMKGRRVGIDCGGAHFAGHEILYDVDTLKPIASFDQAHAQEAKPPRWSISSDEFKSN